MTVARVKTRFRAEPASAGAARRFVSDVLRSRGLEDLVDVSALLVSELVTNAVLYARSEVVLNVLPGPSWVRVEVHDSSDEPAMRRRDRPDEAVPGRGLELVEQLADNWGSQFAEEGKCVWFELRSDRQRAAEQLRRVDLLAVPAATYLALNLHIDGLLHELQTVAGTGGWPEASISDRLHRLLTRSLGRQTAARASAWAQARHAMAAQKETVDITLRVPPSAVDAGRELVELLEEADALCARGELLTLPAPPEVVTLRRWLSDETWAQVHLGRSPQRYPH